ncbi:MAG: hypothetical protein MN733_23200 [Nitrososphaera sp.]|nr:hypothetical protein [Nitrososphaera sp.]
MEKVIGEGLIDGNLSPDAFHRWATHYYKCEQDFVCPHRFSPISFFLLCRGIELEIKAKQLTVKKQAQVKKDFGHNLLAGYDALDPVDRVLQPQELDVLIAANAIHVAKGFEYFDPEDALSGYKKVSRSRSA